MEKEKKIRIPLWITPSTDLRVKQAVERYGYKTRGNSTKAVVLNNRGQLSTPEKMDYVTQPFSSFMEGIQTWWKTRLRRVLYKQAVELAMVENILVNLGNYSPADIRTLRGKVIKDINAMKGQYDFETAANYQNGGTEDGAL